jgi:hypothetical protein
MRTGPCLPNFRLVAAVLCLLACAAPAAPQSGDLSYPTPIFSNEVTGRITPRDIGDPRRTRHFYTFRGTEGDISVTLESAELRGDVDLFTAGTLRPLLKITIYGGPTAATRSVYLRRDETLILRVEARAEGEAEGSYRIRLGGSFAPAPAGLAEAPPPPALPETSVSGRGTRRVTATGARIDEPAPPAEEARAEPSPAPTPDEAAAETAEPRPAPRRGTSRTNTRRGRGTTPTNRRRGGTTTPPAETAREGEAAERDDANPPADAATGETATPPNAARTTRPPARRVPRRPTRRTSPRAGTSPDAAASRPAPDAASPTPEAPGQRLVIVTKDGETIERDMRTVRRVTVENNQIVVVTRDGKVLRQPLSNVSRMAIEP